LARASSSVSKPKATLADVDAYLASLSVEKRGALQKLRRAIAAAAPDAEEGFSYGLPAFRLDGRPLVCYAAAANHCSFYPMSPAVIRVHAADLKRYGVSKGTIRFPAEKPLPAALVRKLVKARIAELKHARR
jgi:uncharacterized protein YdhG (YjbR/CyaY superfamily)